MKELRNQIIWITGASSGIGKALALKLGAHGARLALSARREKELEDICESLREQHSCDAIAVPVDVTDLAALEKANQTITAELGPPDIVIANAGTHLFSKPLDFNANEYNFIMNLNFGGMLNTFHAVLPDMLARKRGHLVGMASLAGYRGLPRAAAYGASKAAMIHFMESIYFHLKKENIKVSICNPGFVKTPLTDKNDFKMPFLMSADAAVDAIITGIRKEKRKIAFPFLFSSILEILRVIPFPIYEFIVEKIVWPSAGGDDD